MQLSRRRTVAMLLTAALAGSAATAVSAVGHDGGGGRRENEGHHRAASLLKANLAPSVLSDPQLDGVNRGGAPWELRRGEATLGRNGRFRVRVRGLVIPTPPSNRTPGPVMTVSASLYCGASSTAVGSTPSAPISRTGDARMEGQLALPPKCLAPVVLVHPNGNLAAYIAASGFGG